MGPDTRLIAQHPSPHNAPAAFQLASRTQVGVTAVSTAPPGSKHLYGALSESDPMEPRNTPDKNNQRFIDKLPEIAFSAVLREVVRKIINNVYPTEN